LHFAFAFAFCILHLHFAFCISISRQKFGIFPIQVLNFPPTFLDSIGEEEEEEAHGDNRGTSSLAFSVKPIS